MPVINITPLRLAANFPVRRAELCKLIKHTITGFEGEINMSFIKSNQMHKCNLKFRDKDCPTDVLSFAYHDHISFSNKQLEGEVLICPSQVQSAAKQWNQDYRSRLAHVVVHGVLHILGYDHQSVKQTRLMRQRESEILLTLGYADPWD